MVERDVAAPLQTHRLEYTLTRRGQSYSSGSIQFTFTNQTRSRVYVGNCNGFVPASVEKLVSEEWRPMWSALYQDCISSPIVIESGATYTYTFAIFGVQPGSFGASEFEETVDTGIYRLNWPGVYYSIFTNRFGNWELAEPVPTELRISNRFGLRVK